MVITALPASHGSKWISDAYNLYFKKAPWIWIAILLIYVVLLGAPIMIPFVGGFIANLLHPAFLAGMMQGCRDQDEGRELRVEVLFAGFRTRFSELITLGVLNLLVSALALGICVVVAIAGLGLNWESIKSGSFAQDASTLWPTIMGICALLAIAATVFTIVAMLFWFAPLLVYFEGRSPIEAMKESFHGCIRNIAPFTIYVLIVMVLAIAASIPLGLGWLVLFPIVTIVDWTSYKEIFHPKGF